MASRVDLYGRRYGYSSHNKKNKNKINKRKIKKRKKKYKIKNNIKIFIIIITIIIIIIIAIIMIKSKNNNKIENKDKNEVINNKQDDKLKQLNYINKKIDYFDYSKIDRYIDYMNNNIDLNLYDVIKEVNMDLDNEYYENSNEVQDTDSLLILVNKYNYLSKDYEPSDLENISSNYALPDMKLRKEAKESFEELSKKALKDNLKIIAMSSYRSYQYQVDLYNMYKNKDGVDIADRYSGRAGFSEHQTGLAVDVYNDKLSYTNFEDTKEFEWMQKNAYKYGFILRFPKDKEKYTGYIYESWHYRYVGKNVAKEIKESGYCLEEYIATRSK